MHVIAVANQLGGHLMARENSAGETRTSVRKRLIRLNRCVAWRAPASIAAIAVSKSDPECPIETMLAGGREAERIVAARSSGASVAIPTLGQEAR